MKNRFRKNILTFFLAFFSTFLVLFSGCSDDFFEEKAGDRISPEQHYKNIVDAMTSLDGAIIYLQDILPKLIVLDGLRTDMMDVTPNANAHMVDINNQIFSPGNPFTNPSDLYKVIININEVLANIDEVAVRDRQYDASVAFIVKGNLIGMRAWVYFTLAQLYGEVAYIEDNLIELPADLNQNFMPKEILIDTLINQVTPYVINDVTQIDYPLDYYVNIKALLGEMYLEKMDYVNAVFYLKIACESYGNNAVLYKVEKSYQNNAWSTIFLNSESARVENIAVMPFSAKEGQPNPLATWFTFDYMIKPSMALIDSFMQQEPTIGTERGDLWRGLGMTFMVDTATMVDPVINKYNLDFMDPGSTDIIISRAADVHLMLAEALNRTGDEADQEMALILLNNGVNASNPKPAPFIRWASNRGVRGRVALKPRIVPEDLTGDARTLYIEDLIMAERAMELAFEGKRWNDLVRVAKRRNDPAYLADRVASKFQGTGQYDVVRAKLMDPENWYLKLK
jgi:starch-binding outer membrane protein, SusD/RagB family